MRKFYRYLLFYLCFFLPLVKVNAQPVLSELNAVLMPQPTSQFPELQVCDGEGPLDYKYTSGNELIACGMGHSSGLSIDIMSNNIYFFRTDSSRWSSIQPLPAGPRTNALLCFLDSNLYAGLGIDFNQGIPYNDLFRYSTSSNSWTICDSFPGAARYLVASTSWQHRLILAGGIDTAFSPCSQVWSYDPLNNSWARLPDLPGSPNELKFLHVDSALHILSKVDNQMWRYTDGLSFWLPLGAFPDSSGLNNTVETGGQHLALSNNGIYYTLDSISFSWSIVAINASFDARNYNLCSSSGSFFAIKNSEVNEFVYLSNQWISLYSSTGVYRDLYNPVVLQSGVFFETLRNDLVTDQWQIDSTFYGTSFRNYYQGDVICFKSGHCARYNSTSQTWTLLATLPIPFNSGAPYSEDEFCGDRIGSKLFVGTKDGTNRFWVYDITADTWSALPAFPGSTISVNSGCSVFEINGQLMLIQGTGFSPNEQWVFDPNNQQWNYLGPLPFCACSNRVVGKIWGRPFLAMGNDDISPVSSKMYILDPYNLVWDSLDLPLTARKRAAVFSVDNQLHVAGGNYRLFNGCYPLLQDHYRLDYLQFIQGIVFNDVNSDCIYDSSEVGQSSVGLILNPGSMSVSTASDGSFVFDQVSPGTYVISVDTMQSLWTSTCGFTRTIEVIPSSSGGVSVDFGLTSINGGIDIHEDQTSFTAYPNPSSKDLTIAGIVTQNDILEVTLWDALGKVVYSSNLHFNQTGKQQIVIPLHDEGVVPGIYTLRCRSSVQQNILKIIIQ